MFGKILIVPEVYAPESCAIWLSVISSSTYFLVVKSSSFAGISPLTIAYPSSATFLKLIMLIVGLVILAIASPSSLANTIYAWSAEAFNSIVDTFVIFFYGNQRSL